MTGYTDEIRLIGMGAGRDVSVNRKMAHGKTAYHSHDKKTLPPWCYRQKPQVPENIGFNK
jgi:hypothetical protein